MEETRNSLPENAQRELAPGEEYKPLLGAERKWAEVTPYSVTLGLLMVVIFSAAAAYLGLRVGQVFEAAIPIAIIAVGLTSALGKKEGLGQNVIIQSIGGCSGAVVAGAIFTLPAIYILGVDVSFMQMFLSSLLGGVLGILFLIPFRKYFVKEMHGKYPFPEATATTQILVSGEGGSKGAGTLLVSGLIGGLYDFIVSTFGAWADTVSTTVAGIGQTIADKAKVVLKLNTGAAVLGLGYIVGLKYAFIICCGSFLVWLVIIPLMNLIWGGQVIDLMGTGVTMTIGEMSPDQIFKDYARHIGIGGAPWLLYGIGAVLAIVLTFLKVPALAFALGMFIPIDLNLPLLIGGAISWFVSTRSKDKALNEIRLNKGTLIASGFIAGGALMGVVSALLKFFNVDWFLTGWNAQYGEAIAIIPFLGIIAYTIIASLRAKE